MSRWKPVGPASDWTSMEERVLQRWRDGDVFRTSVEMRKGHDPYVFYEGPPTANGRPGSHHVLSRVFKDIFPRFHTMRGRYVERKAGWDCHGLPVELEVEKQLGISGKPEIEAYGIAEFNARCRESVGEYLDEWERLTERIGFWVDTSEAYRTMDTDYVESVWWSLATLHDKGLVYESDKVVPYCPRCGTALSSHEVAQGYKDVVDPSIYVKFPLRAGSVTVTDGADEASAGGTSLLVWTTTPWTLPANQAAAINPDTDYAVVVDGDERLVMAEALVGAVMGEGAVVERVVPASDLAGAEYEPPFDMIPGRHVVVMSDFVTTDDGTGIVHIAPAFGEDDGQPRGHQAAQGRRCGGSARHLFALVPALLAVRRAPRVPRHLQLVRRGDGHQGAHGRTEPTDHLGPRAPERGFVRKVDRQRPRLVDQPQSFLGFAHPGLEERRPDVSATRRVRKPGRTRARLRRCDHRSAPPRRRRPRARQPRRSDGPIDDATGSRGARLLVRERLDALRPSPLSLREHRVVRAALSG